MAKGALAYSLVPMNPPRDMRSCASLMCATCPNVGKLPIVAIGNNPEKIEKMFVRLGWDCNVHKPRLNFCPKCVRQRVIRAEDENPKPTRTGGAVLTDAPPLRGPRDAVVAFSDLRAGTRTSSSPKEDKMSIKDLSAEQKAALRRALDANFDDSTGRFIGDVSDHSISEKLNIPRLTVIEFREASYGELKEDPEIAAFVQQMADAKRVLTGLQSTFAKMELKLEQMRRKVGL